MMIKDPYVARSGRLGVGGGHEIYWEDWGNPGAPPVVHLHGGPGAGFNDSHKLLYDPARHRVIFHDQRGSGRSTPTASTDGNTTEDLISDIERLRDHLGLQTVRVAGGSWGATLALLYAMAHPGRVEHMMLWSVFLGRQSEIDAVYAGHHRDTFPEAWERFIAPVPPALRADGPGIVRFYAEKVRSDDQAVARSHADEWCLWEGTLFSVNYDQRRLELATLGDDTNLPVALIETHYFMHECFMPGNRVLDGVAAIRSIPCSVVHGRFDCCTPPRSAVDLARAYGASLTLQWVNAGHVRTDPEMLTALRSIAAVSLS